ncbi:Lectin repeat domain protein [Pseudomonas caricapapayae]|uniref:Lectin repeat domain protein n=1 Tax=Pseudomonas caricapapayae TaxID=46678 RepID=A0A0P9M0R1_9PSED|nr:lectin [Pseudomonas caricapapayae]KAA8697765.1 lectin [Pseudomonas caricapapayae]KPW61039.1 Lectin repeat domain protein [Pseudomonas caricapapayae]RMM07948.1 Lectin repeat domain protein [Pseudomonas caricapapayae]RMV99767.1 Lectin repeat domain protein [Pseudomonas caricapapayae]
MKTLLAFAYLSLLCFFHSSAFSAEMNPYEQILNTSHGTSACLALDSNLSAVSLQECDTTDRQQWIFISSGNMLYIKNKALGGSAQEICLFAVNQSSVKMATCASADSNDYQSKRLWSRNGNTPSVLSNKYIADLGFDNYLRRAENEQLVFGSAKEAAAEWTITQPIYEEIVNTVRGSEKCLTLVDDATSVALETCTGRHNQQWLFTPVGPRLYIKNKALGELQQQMCLFAENQNSVKMATCASAGSNDYQSKRLWSREGNTPSLLSNKYISDRGYDNYLHSNADEQLVFGSPRDDGVNWMIAKRYGYIRNVERGQETCLALSSNNVDVEFSPCKSDPRQDWRMSLIAAGYDKLTNRSLAGGEREKCLGSTVKMMDCQGSGYTSQRSWSYSRPLLVSVPGFILRNKFRNDLGGQETLGFSGDTVQMVPAIQSPAVTWHFELQAPSIPQRPVTGKESKVLLLHAKYSNEPATDLAKVQQGFVGSPGDNYSFINAVRMASGGQLTFKVDTVTDLDLGPLPSDCPSTELRHKAINLARERGFDASSYNYVAVEIPSTSCSWAGLAAMPGSWAMGNGTGWKPWMWQHEFGHSLGGPHAKSLERCSYRQNVVQISGNECVVTDSGDPSDTLNGGGSRLYPIPYLYYAGWLTDQQFTEVIRNGRYEIAPLFKEATASVVRGLHLYRSDGSYLTLEFRALSPGFESWSPDDPFVNGVIVRVARFGRNSVSNTLVDTTPDSEGRMKDAPLVQGKSLDDLLSGKRITVIGIADKGATVEISDLPNNALSAHLPFERSAMIQAVEPPEQEVEGGKVGRER